MHRGSIFTAERQEGQCAGAGRRLGGGLQRPQPTQGRLRTHGQCREAGGTVHRSSTVSAQRQEGGWEGICSARKHALPVNNTPDTLCPPPFHPLLPPSFSPPDSHQLIRRQALHLQRILQRP